MPGPMGGAGGGGFSGGGRAGGSYSGGSRHSTYVHHYNSSSGSIYFDVRNGKRRSPVGDILATAIFIVIVWIICLAVIIGIIVFEPFENHGDYDEPTFHQYADDRYSEAFSATDEYENNILLLFAVHEGYDLYHCIAWGGNDIIYDTNMLFGSYFKDIVRSTIPDHFEKSMTESLTSIVSTMTNVCPAYPEPPSEGFDTSFSVLYNDSELEIDKPVINEALAEFTEKTSYPIAIAVVNAEEIFLPVTDDDSEKPIMIALAIIISALFGTLVVYFLIKAYKIKNPSKKKKNKSKEKNKSKDKKTASRNKTNPNAGQGKYDPNTVHSVD